MGKLKGSKLKLDFSEYNPKAEEEEQANVSNFQDDKHQNTPSSGLTPQNNPLRRQLRGQAVSQKVFEQEIENSKTKSLTFVVCPLLLREIELNHYSKNILIRTTNNYNNWDSGFTNYTNNLLYFYGQESLQWVDNIRERSENENGMFNLIIDNNMIFAAKQASEMIQNTRI